MSMLRITVGPLEFTARLEEADAPQTCTAFSQLLPFRNKIIQAPAKYCFILGGSARRKSFSPMEALASPVNSGS